MAMLSELFPGKYLRAADLKGKDVSAVIETVAIEEFENDGRKQPKPVLYFKGTAKGLVLNKTNSLMVAGICGSEETADWAGKRVRALPDDGPLPGSGLRGDPHRTGRAGACSPRRRRRLPPRTSNLDDEIPF